MADFQQPDFLVTAKVNGDKTRWTTIGAAWRTTSKKGNDYVSVRLNSLPMAWDGVLALHPCNGGEQQQDLVPAE